MAAMPEDSPRPEPRDPFIPRNPFTTTLAKRAESQRIGSDTRADEHQLAAGFWGIVHRGLTSIAAVSAAIAGTSLLTAAKGGWRIAAGILALIASALSALDTTLRAGQLAEDHKRGFDGFTRMRTKWLQFESVTLGLRHTDQELAEEFQRLVSERDQLSERVPAPPRWAAKRVERIRKRQRGLTAKERIDTPSVES
jgi:hypothetical protein